MRNLSVYLNNNCSKHFYLYARREEASRRLDFGALNRALKAARDREFTHLYLAGANIFDYPQFEPLLALASDLGYGIGVEVNQAGKIFPFIDLLKKYNVNSLFFVFAGANPEVNDAIFGKGAFEETLKNLEIAKISDFPVSIRCLVTRLNYASIFEISSFFKKFDPKEFFIQDIWPVGRGVSADFFTSLQDTLEYWPVVKNKISANIKESNFQEDKFHPFIQGREVIIDWNGDIKPFPFSEMKSCGNILEDRFDKILGNLSIELNRLVKRALQEKKFLNWDYYLGNLSNPPRIYPNKNPQIDWGLVDNIFLPSIFSVVMTQKCNFRCDFCEFDCSEDKTAAIDISDFEKLLAEGKKIGASQIVFDGGEPLLHPEIDKAMALCSRYGYDLTILTNGWRFEDFLEQFKKYNIHKFIFGINGATAKTNDRIMGKSGAFDRVVKAIKRSKKLGFFTGLHFMMHRLNIGELDRFFDLARDWQVDYIMTSRITEVGRAQNNSAIQVTQDQINQAREIYKEHDAFLKGIRFFRAFEGDKRYLGCDYLARNSRLSVHADGKIALCSMVPLLNLPFKRIHDYSLMNCLAAMTKVNLKFQADRNKIFPSWHPENLYQHCEYCHECLIKNQSYFFA